MVINLTLSKSSIDAAIRDLKKYQDRVRDKSMEFVRKLAEAGIAVAKERRGEYGDLIYFYPSDVHYKDNIAEIDLVGTDTKIVRKHDKLQREVSPLWMAEFGSGWLANVVWSSVDDMGQGTFPGQTHAENPDGWWYIDDSGEHHHTYGSLPTYPMYFAYLEMIQQVDSIGREVFGGL